MTTSDGSTADYYELPAGATQLQDLISHRDMNAQLGEIFRAAYRYGMASHSGKLRDAKKIKFYIDAEIKRLESLSDSRIQREYNQILDDQSTLMRALPSNQVSRCMICGMQSGHGGLQCPTITPMSNVDPAIAIDDDSERMWAIGQNWNGGEHYKLDEKSLQLKAMLDVAYASGSESYIIRCRTCDRPVDKCICNLTVVPPSALMTK